MPNFLIIGAPKAGTTSLYHYLREHPQIYMSPIKEPYYFAFEEGQTVRFQDPWGSLASIVSTYVTDIESYRGLFDGAASESAIGEASPGYLYDTRAAMRIRHHIPGARLIAILRDPADRAFSQFLMHAFKLQVEPYKDFRKAIQQEPERIRNNWAPQWHYKSRSFYYAKLKRYYELFGREQVRIYLYEDMEKDVRKLMRDLYRFLEVDDSFVPDTSKRYNAKKIPPRKRFENLPCQKLVTCLKYVLPPRVRKNIKSKIRDIVPAPDVPALSPEMRRELIAEFREDILNLQDLIGRDLSRWLEV